MHYSDTTNLKWVQPEVQLIGDWLDERALRAERQAEVGKVVTLASGVRPELAVPASENRAFHPPSERRLAVGRADVEATEKDREHAEVGLTPAFKAPPKNRAFIGDSFSHTT